jgi:glycosyltransferase involved in cell wall biosynthesis
MKHIGIVTFTLPPTIGGVESHLIELIQGLHDRGFSIHVFSPPHYLGKAEPLLPDVELSTHHCLDPFWVRRQKADAGLAESDASDKLINELVEFFRRHVLESKIDVLHAHNLHYFVAEPAHALSILGSECGVPTVLTIHEDWNSPLSRGLMSLFDQRIVISKHVGKSVGIAKSTSLVYYGINLDVRSEPDSLPRIGIDTSRPIVVHPARMLPWKGCLTSLEAIARLVSDFPDILLVLTDTKSIFDWHHELEGYREQVLNKVQTMNLQNNVLVHEFSRPELLDLMSDADIVVYPTLGSEPFGVVPVEAMWLGTPVIVTNSGGLPESVIDGHTGFVIPRDKPESLAQCIRRLLCDHSLAVEMSQNAKRHASTTFSRDRMIDQTVEVYRKAAGDYGKE